MSDAHASICDTAASAPPNSMMEPERAPTDEQPTRTYAKHALRFSSSVAARLSELESALSLLTLHQDRSRRSSYGSGITGAGGSAPLGATTRSLSGAAAGAGAVAVAAAAAVELITV